MATGIVMRLLRIQQTCQHRTEITYLRIPSRFQILFELLVELLHHARRLHAIYNLDGRLFLLLLAHIRSLDDLCRGKLTIFSQPLKYCLIQGVPPVVKGMGHFCICTAKSAGIS